MHHCTPFLYLGIAIGGVSASPIRIRSRSLSCDSDACKDLATSLAKTVAFTGYDTSEVCNKMESFMCDGFRDVHPIQPDVGYVGWFEIMGNATSESVNAYLAASEAPIDTDADRQLFATIKTRYDACMNVEAVKTAGFQPVAEVLDTVAGLFPVDEKAYASLNSTLLQISDSDAVRDLILYLIKEERPGSPLRISPTEDDKDTTRQIVVFAPLPNTMSLDKEQYEDAALKEKYLSVMTDTLAKVHPNKDARNRAGVLAAQILELEIQTSTILPSLDEFQDPEMYYNIMELNEADKLLPIYQVKSIIETLAPKGFTRPILASFPEKTRAIGELWMRTSKETIQTYIFWSIIYNTVQNNNIIADELELLRRFAREANGVNPDVIEDRRAMCTKVAPLGWAIGRWYLHDYFPKRSQEIMGELISDLKKAFTETLSNLRWLEDSVKKTAIEKLEKMAVWVGGPFDNNPVDGNDPQSILSFYNGVTATDSFFDNTAITNRWTVAKAWRELLDPVTVKWRMPAATVNAYQDILHNTMFFPAGIVQPPFFHKDYPSYINFGGIGMIIGHEISHGFDGTGRRYDAQGNLRDWWTDSTSTEVRRREQCFVDQYNNFTFEGPGGQTMHMNGDLTANENMADTNGLDAAYKAWKIYNEKHPEENFELPGLEHFSSDQLFFMSFAYNWCSNQTPERRANRARVDQHALEQFRVLGSLQNSVNFKQSFGCKEKGATCTVWSN